MSEIIEAARLEQWYAVAALALTLVIQIVRKSPVLRNVWQWIPDELRWLVPLVTGAALAFIGAYESGATLPDALLATVTGALGIGLGAMGLATALKQSPVPWDGGAGGVPKDDVRRDTPSNIGVTLLMLVFALTFTGAQACQPTKEALWPSVARCGGDVPSVVVDSVSRILFSDGGDTLSERAMRELEGLAKERGGDLVACVVSDLVEQWTGKFGASEEHAAATKRGQEVLAKIGTRFEE